MTTPATPSPTPTAPSPSASSDGSDPPCHRANAATKARRAALAGNFVDQFDIFLPVVALSGVLPHHQAVPEGLVFAATLLGRPVGAFVLGGMADTFGRARISRATLLGVSLCTGLMATLPLPSGAAVGALMLLRFVAGFFLGGQYSSAIPRALDLTEPRSRGRISGLVMAMSPSANAAIAALTMLLTAWLGAGYAQWGWRVLFALGAVMPLALATSLRGPDNDRVPRSHTTTNTAGRPLAAFGAHADDGSVYAPSSTRSEADAPARVFAALFTLVTGLWLFTMMGVSELTSMLRTHLPPTHVSLVMLVATAVSAVAMALAGSVSSRIGRRRFFIAFGALAMALAPLTYVATRTAAAGGQVAWAAVTAAAVQIVTVTAYGPVGAYLSEHFPEHRRSRGYGTAYSASIVLPGLYPLWLPGVTELLGTALAVPLVLALAGGLVAGAALSLRQADRVGADGR